MVPAPRVPPLLRKELAWGRRNFLTLVFLFLVLPGTFAYGTLAFDTVLPTDAPVAVVPQNDSVTEDDLSITRGAVTPFSEPAVYDSNASAFDALEREQVYAVVTAPPGITDTDRTAVVNVYVSGSVVPYHQASRAVVSAMNVILGSQLPAGMDVEIERHVLGPERALSEYLVPTFLMVLVMVVALVYLPYNLASESTVIDRLRVEGSLAATVGWKIAFFTGLLAASAGVFHATSAVFGYDVALLDPGVLAVYLLTFVTLAAVGLGVTLLARFSSWGRLCNVLLFFFLLTFSGLLYPAGFFSPMRRDLVRLLPTHYSIVAARGFVLRDAGAAQYADWLIGLALVAALALAFLRGAVAVYERGA